MATVMAPPEPPRQDAAEAEGPQQGVIDDARRRQRRRRAGISFALAAIALAGALIALGVDRGGPHRPASATHGPRAGGVARFPQPQLRDLRLIPSLRGGSVGWTIAFGGGEGGASLPTPRTPVFGGFFGYSSQAGWDAIAVTTPAVAAVAFDHVRVPTRDIGLPYGFRVARLHTPATPNQPARALQGAYGPPPTPPTTPTLTALDTHGHAIAQRIPHGGLPTAYWQSPGHAPAGPCRINATPLRGLSPRWGHVAKRLRSYNDVIGRTFESCVDTEFYLHNWPLDTAILLEAAHPGRPPASIPNMTRVAGTRETFAVRGAFPSQDMTATRLPNAWLAVQGGAGPAQRLTVLRHLRAYLSLN